LTYRKRSTLSSFGRAHSVKLGVMLRIRPSCRILLCNSLNELIRRSGLSMVSTTQPGVPAGRRSLMLFDPAIWVGHIYPRPASNGWLWAEQRVIIRHTTTKGNRAMNHTATDHFIHFCLSSTACLSLPNLSIPTTVHLATSRPSAKSTPSGCCSRSRFVHPPTAYQRR